MNLTHVNTFGDPVSGEHHPAHGYRQTPRAGRKFLCDEGAGNLSRHLVIA